jgi:hypothetical protein
MARIRSIHPGLWTDEAFVCASPLARLLFIGIWNECDDRGSFDWSPVKLKMRVLPGDNSDTSELLAELIANSCVMKYEIDGKSYGAVRNFTRFQRPKKPNSIYPQTDEVRNWCGTPSEIAPQREDGGDKMKEEGGKEKEEGDARNGAPARQYAFSGRVVRLTKEDFDNWRKTYHAIPDLAAELTSIDAWIDGQDADKRKKWFHVASGSLNRKHQELLSAAKASRRSAEIELPIA